MSPILLPLPPSANSQYPGTKRRHKSEEYKAWEISAGWELLLQKPTKFTGKVAVLYEVREPPTKQEEDLENRLKATMDLLVKHRVIVNDSNRYVRMYTLIWAPDVEGVRVTIQQVE